MIAAIATVAMSHQYGNGALPSPTGPYIQFLVIEGNVEDVVVKAPRSEK